MKYQKNSDIGLTILFILLVVGSIIGSIAILNSDLPDIWKWFLLK